MTACTYRALGAAALTSAAIAAYACGDNDVYHRRDLPISGGVVVNLGSQALTMAQVRAILGSYGPGCGQPVGTTEWSITVNGTSDGLAPALQVNEGSNDCELILTRVAGLVDGRTVMFTASPGVALRSTYQGGAVRFAGDNGVSFYSNARLVWSGEPWRSNLTVEFLFSDDPNFDPITGEVTPGFVVINAPNVAGVPSPRYTFGVGSLSVIPPARIAGSSTLVMGDQVGTEFKIVPKPAVLTATPTFGDIDAAYGSSPGTPLPQDLVFAGSAFEPAAARLAAEGQAAVWLIIANVQHGVRSYQAIELTFRSAQAADPGHDAMDAGTLLDAATEPTTDAASVP